MLKFLPDASRAHAALWIAVFIGAASFLLVFGAQTLNPSHIGWLQIGDRAQHFLGWQFFRHGPWQFPIGLNPDYGLELSSSIIYSDSNPLFAVFFKLFSTWLPEPFQYFGFWLLLCFVLQGGFAWLIAGTLGLTRLQQALISLLAVFSPPFLFRLLYHMSLGGHFIILAALFLSIRRTEHHRAWPWVILLCAAVGLHAYLFVMASAIWLAQLLDLLRCKRFDIRKAFIECVLVAACVGLTMWQVGYFATKSVSAAGYGSFRMNLLSYFNPSVHGWNWSYLLKGLPFDGARDGFEGFNYAGLGTLCLIPFAIYGATRLRHVLMLWLREHYFLVLIVLLMAVFALSNVIGVGQYDFQIRVPDKLLQLANTFRASGRLFWPAFYMLLFLLVFCVAKAYRSSVAALLLSGAVILQLADSRAGWHYLQDDQVRSPSTSWNTPMKDPSWSALMSHYAEIRSTTPGDIFEWKAVAYLAGMHHRATDSVMLARLDESKLLATQKARRLEVMTGHYAPNALYVLDESTAFELAPRIKAPDLLTMLDGALILAPGWLDCGNCPTIGVSPVIDQVRARYDKNSSYHPHIREFDFSKSGNDAALLGEGWSWPEPWGLWSNGNKATVTIPASEDVFMLTLKVHPHVNKILLDQTVIVQLNGEPGGTFTLSETLPTVLKIPVTPDMKTRIRRDGSIHVSIDMPGAAAPSAMGTGQDDRLLGVGLYTIKTYE